MTALAALVERSHRLHGEDRVTEITTARVFSVDDGRTFAVVLSVDGTDAWCSCPTEGACEHVGAALLKVRDAS